MTTRCGDRDALDRDLSLLTQQTIASTAQHWRDAAGTEVCVDPARGAVRVWAPVGEERHPSDRDIETLAMVRDEALDLGFVPCCEPSRRQYLRWPACRCNKSFEVPVRYTGGRVLLDPGEALVWEALCRPAMRHLRVYQRPLVHRPWFTRALQEVRAAFSHVARAVDHEPGTDLRDVSLCTLPRPLQDGMSPFMLLFPLDQCPPVPRRAIRLLWDRPIELLMEPDEPVPEQDESTILFLDFRAGDLRDDDIASSSHPKDERHHVPGAEKRSV